MPEQNDPTGGKGGASPPRAPSPFRHILVFSLAAMLAGYFLAGYAGRRIMNRGGAVREFETMNTYGRITVPEGGSEADAATLAEMAEKAVQRVNELMSPFGANSDVKRLNDAPAGQWVEVDSLTWTVVMEALRWHRLTGGAFDPTIGPVKQLFKFDQSELATWPDADQLAKAKTKVGAEKLLFDREGMRLAWTVDGMRLDLGAIAKGFAADEAARVLQRNGVTSALVDIGGELRALGEKPGVPPAAWRAGIRDPRGDGILEKLDLIDSAVATSGDYERFFTYRGKRYEHIIDPRQGLPLTEGVASATVVHPVSCLAADALATTLCVMGPKAAKTFLEDQALGLFSDGVHVVMLVVDDSGKLQRIEYEVLPGGEVTASTRAVHPEAPENWHIRFSA